MENQLSEELKEQILEMFSKRYYTVSKLLSNPDTEGFIKVAAVEECKKIDRLWREFEDFYRKKHY